MDFINRHDAPKLYCENPQKGFLLSNSFVFIAVVRIKYYSKHPFFLLLPFQLLNCAVKQTKV